MPDTPTPEDDQRQIAADEACLAEVDESITKARQTHEATKASGQSGLLPEAEGDDGEANAADLQT